MSGHIAFRGDAAVKALAHARVAAHLAAGTLTIGPTRWDGTGGSALGVTSEGTDIAAYSDMVGYPPSLAALLDPLLSHFPDESSAGQAALDWIDAVTPGADLSPVPARLARLLLDEPALAETDPALTELLKFLHERDAAEAPPPRTEWAAARERILAAGPDLDERRARSVFDVFEAAAWPATRGRSTLVNMLSAIGRLRAATFQPGWSAEREAEAMTMMEAMWEETDPARREGLDYLSELRARAPEVWAGFTANLEGTNKAVTNLGPEIADKCLALFRAA